MSKTILFEPVPGNAVGYDEPRMQVGSRIYAWFTDYPETSPRWHQMCDCDLCLNRLWNDEIFKQVKASNRKAFFKLHPLVGVR